MSMDMIGYQFWLLVGITSFITAGMIPITVLTVLWLCNDKVQVIKPKKGQSLNLKIYKERKK